MEIFENGTPLSSILDALVSSSRRAPITIIQDPYDILDGAVVDKMIEVLEEFNEILFEITHGGAVEPTARGIICKIDSQIGLITKAPSKQKMEPTAQEVNAILDMAARSTYYYMKELNESLKDTHYMLERYGTYRHPATPKARCWNQMIGYLDLDESDDTLLSMMESEGDRNGELNRVELPNGESKALWYVERCEPA